MFVTMLSSLASHVMGHKEPTQSKHSKKSSSSKSKNRNDNDHVANVNDDDNRAKFIAQLHCELAQCREQLARLRCDQTRERECALQHEMGIRREQVEQMEQHERERLSLEFSNQSLRRSFEQQVKTLQRELAQQLELNEFDVEAVDPSRREHFTTWVVEQQQQHPVRQETSPLPSLSSISTEAALPSTGAPAPPAMDDWWAISSHSAPRQMVPSSQPTTEDGDFFENLFADSHTRSAVRAERHLRYAAAAEAAAEAAEGEARLFDREFGLQAAAAAGADSVDRYLASHAQSTSALDEIRILRAAAAARSEASIDDVASRYEAAVRQAGPVPSSSIARAVAQSSDVDSDTSQHYYPAQ